MLKSEACKVIKWCPLYLGQWQGAFVTSMRNSTTLPQIRIMQRINIVWLWSVCTCVHVCALLIIVFQNGNSLGSCASCFRHWLTFLESYFLTTSPGFDKLMLQESLFLKKTKNSLEPLLLPPWASALHSFPVRLCCRQHNAWFKARASKPDRLPAFYPWLLHSPTFLPKVCIYFTELRWGSNALYS